MELPLPDILTVSKYLLIPLSLLIMLRCIRSMLSDRYEAETWASVRFGRESVPVTHWENLIGRSRTADIRIDREGIERIHAVLKRRDDGRWMLFDVFARGGVWVDGRPVGPEGAELAEGAAAKIGSVNLRLQDLGAEKSGALEEKRTAAGKRVSPALTLFELTVFELLLLLQHLLTSPDKMAVQVALAFQKVFGIGCAWRVFGSQTNTEDAARAYLLDPGAQDFAPMERWASLAAAEIAAKMVKPEIGARYAQLLIAILPPAAGALTDEERKLVASDETVLELREPVKVRWSSTLADAEAEGEIDEDEEE